MKVNLRIQNMTKFDKPWSRIFAHACFWVFCSRETKRGDRRRYLVSQVPDPDGAVVAGGDEDIFEGVSRQTPDSSLSVSVDHRVGRCVLLSDLDDLPVFGSHQDFTLDDEHGGELLNRTTMFSSTDETDLGYMCVCVKNM